MLQWALSWQTKESESNLLCPVVKTIHRFTSRPIEYLAMKRNFSISSDAELFSTRGEQVASRLLKKCFHQVLRTNSL
jgi:hypothetical protein